VGEAFIGVVECETEFCKPDARRAFAALVVIVQ
jgi:hypothetical protein